MSTFCLHTVFRHSWIFDRCLSLFSPERCKGSRARELAFLLPLTSASTILGSQKTLKALAVTNNWYVLTEPLPRRAVPPRPRFLHKGAGGMARSLFQLWHSEALPWPQEVPGDRSWDWILESQTPRMGRVLKGHVIQPPADFNDSPTAPLISGHLEPSVPRKKTSRPSCHWKTKAGLAPG